MRAVTGKSLARRSKGEYNDSEGGITMPRQKSGTYDHKSYQNEYHKAMKTKLISFNPASAADMAMWEHLMKQDNVTGYIKGLIRKDMNKGTEP